MHQYMHHGSSRTEERERKNLRKLPKADEIYEYTHPKISLYSKHEKLKRLTIRYIIVKFPKDKTKNFESSERSESYM